MFYNLKIAFHNLRHHALYSWINIVGLAISLAATILIMLWVWDELSYDKFHRYADVIYRIDAKMGETYWSNTPAPVALLAKNEIPEIEKACRIGRYGKGFWEYNNKKFYGNTFFGAAVDTSFFDLFDFPIVKGSHAQLFTDDLSMVISESKAAMLFGDEDPIGKTLTTNDKMLFHITGVMKDMPKNSSLHYDYVVPFAVQQRTYGGNGHWKKIEEDWGNYSYQTYLQLIPTANAQMVGEKISDMVTRIRNDSGQTYNFVLESLSKLHLFRPDGQPEGMKTVRLFSIIAILILLIACINYVNLVTARAAKRSKAISVKKIMGSSRTQLMLQLTGETMLLFFVALLLSTIILYLLMPAYNQLAGKEMVFSLLNPSVLWIYSITTVSVILLAGLYPAVFLSSFKPLDAFRKNATSKSKHGYFRKALVVLQFIFSFGLIIATVVISSQMDYMRTKDLGYDKENVFTVRTHDMGEHYEVAKNELLKNPDIIGISATDNDYMAIGSSRSGSGWEGKEESNNPVVFNCWARSNFMEMMDLKLVSGEYPSEKDSTGVWLNEEAVKVTGLENPIGKRFYLNQGDENYLTIKGVVKNYHFETLNETIKPLIIVPSNESFYLYVKTTVTGAKSAVAAVEKLWKRYNPNYEFSYCFLDDNFNLLYESDLRTEKLLYIFSLIAIFVSCLGLFGLVTFTAETKTKEIGIRKVLGAKIGDVVAMLSKEFLVLVGIAMIMAFPLAWWLLNRMLQDYAYRIDISWWMFALAALVTLVLTLLTVGWQAVKAATANPVKSIKTE